MSCTEMLPDACWIWPKISLYLNNSYAGFRYDFEQDVLPSSAPFVITADQAYKLHVNGEYVCRGPMRGQQNNWHYDTVDLLPYLKTGHNWISIEAHNPGNSTFYYSHKDAAGLLCSAEWDNGVKIISRGSDWQVFRNTAYNHNTAQLSSQMGRMEELDLRFDDRSWITEESGYTLPPEMPGVCCMEKCQGVLPWTNITPRTIPMLREEFIPADGIIASGIGVCAEIPPQAPGIIVNTAYHFLKNELDSICYDESPVSFEQNGNALKFTVPASGKGKFSMVTIDLGKHTWLPGSAVMEFGENDSGTIVDLFYNQYSEEGKIPFHKTPAEGSCVALASRLHLNGKPGKVELFQIMGARFATMIFRETTKPLDICFAWRSTVYPLEKKGSFSCSDDILNQIYKASIHTQEVCSMDAYVDTPWREQSQWWGDARIQAKNTFFLAGDPRLFAAGIQSIAEQTNDLGLTYANAPTKACGPVLPDFSLTWIITLRDLWFQTGKTDHLPALKEKVDKIFAYFENHRNSDGLIFYDPRCWLFEDWSSLPKRNVPTYINLWYIYAEEQYLSLLKAAGFLEDAAALEAKIAQEKKIAEKWLFDPEQQLFLPELNEHKQLTGSASVHDQVLAVLLGLRPGAKDSMIQKVILPCLKGTLTDGAQPSSFWATYLLDCAFDNGLQKDALAYIRTKWAPMLPAGTVWEKFPDKGSECSCSHAWSAHPISHLPELVSGLKQLEANWKKIRLKPEFLLEEAEFSLPLPQGLLTGKITGSAENYSVEFKIPEGVSAEIILPSETIHASGKTVKAEKK
ncbi:MAG: hypothetical protein E7040_06050 [Lentisphaerae bacterium]|nr:hypothetical protein [Lentisphaerota bacterium]